MDYNTLMVMTDEILKHKDPHRNYHGRKVAELAIKVCDVLNMKPSAVEREMIFYGAGLHDIGKIFLPDNLLNKNRKLTSQEFEAMKSHVTMGRLLAFELHLHPIVIEIAEFHHENSDGSGYLAGKYSTETPWYVQMVRVIDSYDAMTSNRSHGRTRSDEEAFAELDLYTGKWYEEPYVHALKKIRGFE